MMDATIYANRGPSCMLWDVYVPDGSYSKKVWTAASREAAEAWVREQGYNLVEVVQ